MSIVRQQSLFDIHELYEKEPSCVMPFFNVKPRIYLGFIQETDKCRRPKRIKLWRYSLLARVGERIGMIKYLVKRLMNDPFFRLNCGFLHSDTLPSESSYLRMITLISESDAMTCIHDEPILLAMEEEHIIEENIAIGATHFEERDRATDPKGKPTPKKRVRKPKAQREQWLKDKQAEEEARSNYEKEIVHQLSESAETLYKEAPIDPKWASRKTVGKKTCFGLVIKPI